MHGTTTGDNTMIQMTGAPTGLIVTRGFRDEIEFRRCYKEDIWDPALPAPRPIARRRVRLEVDERLTAEGDIDTPLDEEQVRAGHQRGCARSASHRSRSASCIPISTRPMNCGPARSCWRSIRTSK